MKEAAPEKSISLNIESRLENIGLIGDAVRGICDSLFADEKTCYGFELCVVEAVTNSIKHAYDMATDHIVEVLISIFNDRIEFQICDTGKSMDFTDRLLHPGALDFDPEKRPTIPEGGMGLYIIGSTMDEVHYESNYGKNILTLVKTFGQITV
jgi:serine/threonine-protein kinase RsbW